jgi:hypothetical protein
MNHSLSDSIHASLKALAIIERRISTLIDINARFFSCSVKATFVAGIAGRCASSASACADASVASELILALGVLAAHVIACVALVDVRAFVSPVELESVSASAFVRSCKN